MQKVTFRAQFLSIVFCLSVLVVASCSPVATNNPPTPIPSPSQTLVNQALPPSATNKPISASPSSTPDYYSAPRDEALDTACRITINLFFNYKGDAQSYRNLFTKDAQYLADGFKPSPDAAIILELMPATEEWIRDFPATPIPDIIIPGKSNEYIYYVKLTSLNDQTDDPSDYFPPTSMNVIMVADGPNSCKVANYGQG